jgi:hypothetical protein
MTRSTILMAALSACAAATGCSNGAGIDIQNYDVTLASQPLTAVRADGALVITIDLIVGTDVGRVIGASLGYAVSAGDVSPSTGVSGADGLASVTWTVTPAQAAGQSELTFAACADNQDPPTCAPGILAKLQPGSTP